MAASLEALVKERGIYKGKISKIINWYNKNATTETDYLEFEARLDCLTQAFTLYEAVNMQIMNIDSNSQDKDDIDDKYCSCRAKLRGKIITLSPQSQTQQASVPVSNHQGQKPNVNLPQLHIPRFNGDLTSWNAFYQLFNTLIVNNNMLSNIEKLIYLKSYLSGEPLHLIDTLQLTDSNLNIAIETLKQRYDNQLSIIFSHIKNLVDIPSLTKVNAHIIRDFIVKIKQNLDSLKTQGIPVDQWDLILIYIFSQKLDYGTRKAYIAERGAHISKATSGTFPKLDDLLSFLESRCSVLEDLSEPKISPHTQTGPPRGPAHSSFYRATHLAQGFNEPGGNGQINSHHTHSSHDISNKFGTSRPTNCIFCKLPTHRIYSCSQFIQLPLNRRSDFVYQNKLCINCLGSKHHIRDCMSLLSCSVCKKRHHSLLHSASHPTQRFKQNNSQNNARQSNQGMNSTSQPPEPKQPSQTNPNDLPQQTTNSHQTLTVFTQEDNEVLLATALVNIVAKNGHTITARAILDSGSTISIITERLLEMLNHTPETQNVQISGIGGKIEHTSKVIRLTLCSLIGNFSLDANCCILNKITDVSPRVRVKQSNLQIPQGIELADPKFDQPACVDMLLGADIYYKILSGDLLKINEHSLTLVGTHFGYLLSGLIPPDTFSTQAIFDVTNNRSCLLARNSDLALDSLLEKFWNMENCPQSSEKILSPENNFVETNFRETTVILNDGSFQVNLPLKIPEKLFPLGESFFLAKKRFLNLERRFEKNPNLFQEYKNFIDEYLSLGHAQVVPLSLKNIHGHNKYFLPHHCVIREQSTSTKLRVVFDGSMKSSSGLSLNDTMYKGYTVQPDLYDILLRFRSFKFVLTADIEKMYRQVRVNPRQTYLQNILWRSNPAHDFQCIELQTVTYGTNSAPYLATRVLNELAFLNKEEYPLAADTILSQCYVDDLLCGQDTLDKLKDLYFQLNEICKGAHFKLHKWCSNSNSLLKIVNSSNVSSDVQAYDIKVEGVSNKVLGISWNSEADVFSISLPDVAICTSATKRDVLSKIAQMFDPLGLIGPIIVNAKIFMQDIWKAKIGWDEYLNDSLLTIWNSYFQNITQLKCLKIPRYIFHDNQISSVELHGFCDASRKAFGSCVYLRTIYLDNSVSCYLITSKSRVTPIKEVTIPRLELCGALLLSTLISRVKSIFKDRYNFHSVNLWTDSEIVLAWLKADSSRFNVFVANRISQIQSLTNNYVWRHIPGAENPADCLSRGTTSEQIMNSSLWWNGPQFLQTFDFDLDSLNIKVPPTHEEERKESTVLLLRNDNFWETLFDRFSNYSKLRRSIAFILRFINNSRANSQKLIGPLTVDELRNSELFIIKTIQSTYFSKELNELKSPARKISDKQILKLNPFIDGENVIRVGGRLSQALVPYDQKFPILLPSKNRVVKLLLLKEHIRLGHAGPQTVLSNLRLRYWPLNGLREIKKECLQCMTCCRFKIKNHQQLMADLPKDRVIPSRPFSRTGVDFGGPFFVKSSSLRRSKTEKCYIALFVCMVTKAIHIELVSSLSTEAFLASLKRFISRRGNPHVIFSDNGTNFLGARNQLREFYTLFKSKSTQEQINDLLVCNEINWKFIPPHSPHWGGLWEAGIKSTKYHLRRLAGQQNFTFEELYTILTQIEAILNSRPLLPLSSDPSDFTCLTPGHFLIGTSLTSFPEKDLSNISENRLNRWQRCVKIQQQFWSKWSKDYLNLLQNRPKWLYPSPNLQVNDIVFLKEINTKPLDWPLARVLEIIPSKDGNVRLVKVKSKNGILTRNVTKLCPLPKLDN
ncbi:uncharacterized protein LOC115879487 [Sitophilus oryzae]|uniref:Uncharacterized protein LOC115879487 n=1 Tax=Sitophilus oryzae TaxID=7048 RepID=A0A6J2XLQ5_SITOR|nr:uncharacterized protein LOC115879487 [Sitophilus oryzae]